MMETPMQAMVLESHGAPLRKMQMKKPVCGAHEVLIKVNACAVCRTDLHIVDGELSNAKLPLVPGHEIVGTVEETGLNIEQFKPGDRVGVPWLGSTCGKCSFCMQGRENLCESARFTGYQIDGGYAEYTVANERFVFPLDINMTDVQAAPLLCAGLIGYRSLRMVGEARRIGIYGFGAAAHIVTQVAIFEGREIFAFTRAGDEDAQNFAMTLGAVWSGDAEVTAPELLDAAIIFAPVGDLVPAALRAVARGGMVVCAGIHMSTIPAFPYKILWGERSIKSVANLTRRDGEEFLPLAARIPIITETELHELGDANLALNRLRNGQLKGAAVLKIDS